MALLPMDVLTRSSGDYGDFGGSTYSGCSTHVCLHFTMALLMPTLYNGATYAYTLQWRYSCLHFTMALLMPTLYNGATYAYTSQWRY